MSTTSGRKDVYKRQGLGLDKDKIRDKTEENRKEIAALQDKLYAESKESLILILQAMDAAGKDSTIKHVMGCVDPQGLDLSLIHISMR